MIILSEIESAYRLKLRELHLGQEEDMGACLARMRCGGGRGSDLNVLRQAGRQLADDALARCEEGLPELILAHREVGEDDVSAFAEAVRTKFIDVALAGLPGASLYASVRGGPGPVVQGKMLRQSNTRFTERVVDRTVLPELQRIVARGADGVGYAYAEGGDEMLIHLPNASPLMAASLADSLRIAMAIAAR